MTPDELREATANDLLRLWKLGDEIMDSFGIPKQRAVTRQETEAQTKRDLANFDRDLIDRGQPSRWGGP